MVKRLVASMALVAAAQLGCRTLPRSAGVPVAPSTGPAVGSRGAAGGQESVPQLWRQMADLLRGKQYAKALVVGERILANHDHGHQIHYYMAVALVLTDRPTAAVEQLRLALDDGLPYVGLLTRDPFTSLRGEEHFEALLGGYGAVAEEERAPAVATMERILAEPRFRQFVPYLLPRHRSAALTPDTLALLKDGGTRLQSAALVSLVHQNANQATARSLVADLLGSPSADVRAAAAEYFVWHGTLTERARIAAAAATEQDPFALAAERAALEQIAKRGRRGGLSDAATVETRSPGTTPCQAAVAALKRDLTFDGLRRAGDAYRSGWEIDPKLAYSGMNVDGKALEEQRACMGLAVSIFGFTGRPSKGGSAPAPPVATSFMPPVRNYFDSSRMSFGQPTGERGPFRDSVHVGDDVAMGDDNGTVVAIADGVVRAVSHTYSWGFIVIVEHRLPRREGSYCSLYAHLSPSLSVTRGQIVRKGERIGAVGRSNTWENGGYLAHLHFGIHRGPYLQYRLQSVETVPGLIDASGSSDATTPDATWITGYVSPVRWAGSTHGWVEPQAFIRQREITATPPQPPSRGR